MCRRDGHSHPMPGRASRLFDDDTPVEDIYQAIMAMVEAEDAKDDQPVDDQDPAQLAPEGESG